MFKAVQKPIIVVPDALHRKLSSSTTSPHFPAQYKRFLDLRLFLQVQVWSLEYHIVILCQWNQRSTSVVAGKVSFVFVAINVDGNAVSDVPGAVPVVADLVSVDISAGTVFVAADAVSVDAEAASVFADAVSVDTTANSVVADVISVIPSKDSVVANVVPVDASAASVVEDVVCSVAGGMDSDFVDL